MKRLLTFSVGSAALLISCLPAAALESSYKATSTTSVADMWAKIGNFCGIGNWHPAVAKCDLSADGKERTLSLKGGGTIIEHLVRRNDKAHSYTYKIKQSPLPIEGYESTIKVTPHGTGSVVTWSGHYKAKGATPAKAKEAIDGIYKAGVDSLVK
jgi:hypothetical protein